jgi:hypothetical protein
MNLKSGDFQKIQHETLDNIVASTYSTYIQHLNELPNYNKIQFLSRMYLFCGKEQAHAKLIDLFGKKYRDKTQQKELIHKALLYDFPVKNSATKRAPYLKKHPKIRKYALVLIEGVLAESLFNIDIRQEITSIVGGDELHTTYEDIMNDKESIAYLSTYAINFIFLYKLYYLGETIDIECVLQQSQLLKLDDREEFLLYFYFITHCVIGASQFYQHPPTEKHLDIIKPYVSDLITKLNTDTIYNLLHLDCKYETLVVAKICDIDAASIKPKIVQETLESFYTIQGKYYVIDQTYVDNMVTNKLSLTDSQHRNMLMIMSQVERHALS